MKRIIIFLLIVVMTVLLMSNQGSCTDAQLASHNISKAADQFEIFRRVVFYNGITNEYILVIEGFCSVDVDSMDNQLELTVKKADGTFMKHFLGLSDNVTYFAEQLYPAKVSDARYRVIFKPSVIIPNFDVE